MLSIANGHVLSQHLRRIRKRPSQPYHGVGSLGRHPAKIQLGAGTELRQLPTSDSWPHSRRESSIWPQKKGSRTLQNVISHASFVLIAEFGIPLTTVPVGPVPGGDINQLRGGSLRMNSPDSPNGISVLVTDDIPTLSSGNYSAVRGRGALCDPLVHSLEDGVVDEGAAESAPLGRPKGGIGHVGHVGHGHVLGLAVRQARDLIQSVGVAIMTAVGVGLQPVFVSVEGLVGEEFILAHCLDDFDIG